MSTLQESLLESMSILAESSMRNAPGTTVIEAVVKEVLDAGTGEYRVSYLENTLTVYSSNSNIEYNIGDKVYVLIPNGDFSKQKVIISLSTPSTITYSTSEENHYMQVSDNLLRENYYPNIQLCSYKEEERFFLKPNDYFNLNFSNYLKKYNNFVFSVDIKTTIPKEQQINGNYGITLMLPFYTYDAEGNKIDLWKRYTLDVNNISGNPYNLTEWSRQKLYIQIDSNELYDTDKCPQFFTFCKGFAQADDKKNDIFIKNFGFYVYDVLSEQNQTGYYLHLAATEGNYFFGGAFSTKILIPTLKINGKDVKLTNSASEDKYKCYWFKEDAAVKTDSEYYTTLGGIGWKCLNDRKNIVSNEEGNKTFDLITNSYSLKINKKDVITSMRYKCVIEIVKSNVSTVVVDAILNIENLLSDVKITLSSITGSTSYIKNTGNVGLKCAVDGLNEAAYPDAKVTYEWNRYDKNNKYIDNNFYVANINNNKEQQISFITGIIEDMNIFICSVYVEYNLNNIRYKDLLGTRSIMIDTKGTSSFVLSIQNGDVLYKYDVDGDSPLRENYDGPLESKVNFIKPLTYTIYKADGHELTESEYAFCKTTWLIPKKSLIQVDSVIDYDENYYKVETIGRSNLEYTLASYYNFKKTNNTIILKVQFNNIELIAEAPIKMLKEGENGTNNSNYSAVLVHNDAAYGELKNGIVQKMQGIYVAKEQQWYYHNLNYATNKMGGQLLKWGSNDYYPSFKNIKLNVYKSGEKIDKSNYTVKWEFFDGKFTNPCFKIMGFGDEACIIAPDNLVSWDGENAFKEYVNILQAKITIKDSDNISNTPIELYAYYPIEIARVGEIFDIESTINGETKYFIPTCLGGFSTVLYAADGTNPQYNSSEPFTFVDSFADINDAYIFNNISYKTSENFTYVENANQITLKPKAKYDASITKNYVSANIIYESSEYFKSEIDKYQDEYDYAKSLKEFYIQEQEDLINFVRNYRESTILQNFKLKSSLIKPFLSLRMKILDNLSELLNKLNNLEQYLLDLSNKGISIQLDFNESNSEFFKTRRNQIANCELQLKNLSTIELTKIDKIEDFLYNENNISAGIKTYLKDLIKDFNTYINNDYNKNIEKYKTVNIDDFKILIDNYIKNSENNNYLKILIDNQDLPNRLSFESLKRHLMHIREEIYDESATPGNKVKYFTYSDILNAIKEGTKLVSNQYGNGTLNYATNLYYKEAVERCEKDAAAALDKLTKVSSYAKRANSIFYIRPIVMTFNRYELSNITGWDGNRLYTGQGKEGEYLYAPQMGAGKKENDGSFTGIVMGNRNVGGTEKIGLYGFNQGIQTIELDSETGSAIFGKSGGGQIIIDPTAGDNEAVIKSGNYVENKSGMIINLSKPFIEFGSGKFAVNEVGQLTAKGGGSIGGWFIGDTDLRSRNAAITLDSENTKIYSQPHNDLDSKKDGFFLSPLGLSIGAGFKVSKTGILQVGNLKSSNNRYWEINANEEKDFSYISYKTTAFGSVYDKTNNKWTIGGGSDQVYLGTDGIRLGNKFAVDADGNLAAQNAYITGEIYSESGTIGGWTIGPNTLSANGIEINSNGTILSPGNWAIYGNSGKAVFNDAQVTGEIYSGKGKIGGWTIDTDRIYSTGVEFKANGTLICSGNWAVYGATGDSNAGKAIFNNAEIKGKITSQDGEIGGWKIGTNSLSAGNILIKSDGTIQSNNFSSSAGWQINGSGSATFRDVVINGYTTATDFSAAVGRINTIESDYITTGELEAVNVSLSGKISAAEGEIDDLTVDTINIKNTITSLSTDVLSINDTLKYGGIKASWQQKTVVTSVSTKTYSLKAADGSTVGVTGVLNVKDAIIFFLGVPSPSYD